MPPTMADLNAADRTAFVAVLGSLFEHSPWVAEDTWPARPFRDSDHLFCELCASLRRAPRARQLDLIRAHPDLAGRLAVAGRLTAASTHEQASAGLDRMADDERTDLQRLNDAYRARFGFPFIICARLNAKDAIVQAMRRRLDHSPEEEFTAALAEIEKIARLRLADAMRP